MLDETTDGWMLLAAIVVVEMFSFEALKIPLIFTSDRKALKGM